MGARSPPPARDIVISKLRPEADVKSSFDDGSTAPRSRGRTVPAPRSPVRHRCSACPGTWPPKESVRNAPDPPPPTCLPTLVEPSVTLSPASAQPLDILRYRLRPRLSAAEHSIWPGRRRPGLIRARSGRLVIKQWGLEISPTEVSSTEIPPTPVSTTPISAAEVSGVEG
jgi:hypothetical protein